MINHLKRSGEYYLSLYMLLNLFQFIISIWLFASFIALIKGIPKKKLSIILALITLALHITMLGMDIIETIHILQKSQNPAITPNIILYIINTVSIPLCLLLILLSMDNKIDKGYTTRTLPRNSSTQTISTKNFPFAIIMSLITFGIYYLYWRYCIVKDIRKVDGELENCFGEWLLLIFIPFYDWFWLYTRANKLSVIAANNKIKATGNGILYVILDIFFMGWVNTLLIQNTPSSISYMQNNSTANNDYVSKLKNLNELKMAGIISEEEFNIKKKNYYLKYNQNHI